MFDTIVQDRRPQHHTHHTRVIEQRAPTDESIRLANEMREKLLKEITHQTFLPSELGINAAITVISQPWNMDGPLVVVVYCVGAKKQECHVQLSWHDDTPQKWLVHIKNDLAAHIAAHLLQDNFRPLLPLLQRYGGK